MIRKHIARLLLAITLMLIGHGMIPHFENPSIKERKSLDVHQKFQDDWKHLIVHFIYTHGDSPSATKNYHPESGLNALEKGKIKKQRQNAPFTFLAALFFTQQRIPKKEEEPPYPILETAQLHPTFSTQLSHRGPPLA
ncbi:hypothetical protein [Xanthovirga aplysinae]|uniref:hypothetical protein n=1 Tax=Xanthovirga aplysinae TaxID=2529853 RepID=UPI0012BB6A97|nr:hypothetical protein [Xanthovirga aplysinae]MTI31258.1 hypothetical protein [Xanthovirga aplysinae]